MNVELYFWQRLTAAIMAPLLLIHLALIFYATSRGLVAADILQRTRGSIAWASFYGSFVVAAAVHAPIGLRSILQEWTPLGPRARDLTALCLGLLLVVLGLRAVYAVVRT